MVDIALNQRVNERYVSAKTARMDPVSRLVERAGFAFPLIDGINAITKTQLPKENTQSCQIIFKD